MNIVFFELDSWERTFFGALSLSHSIRFIEGPLHPAHVDELKETEILSVFIYSRLDRSVLERLPKLRLIATRSTGVDHIDLDYCDEHGIAVKNVPTYGESTVAEHVFALLLALSHHVIDAVDRTRKGDFSLAGLRGFDLCGKILGVIGTGNIGRHVIKIARGFQMTVLAHDLKPDMQLAHGLDFRYVPMRELLSQSDVITLHVAGGEKTRNLISRAEFEMMKQGVVLINTARGSIVNVQALLESIAQGKVAAAGLDVIAEEPTIREEAELLSTLFTKRHDLETLLADHLLLRMRNVIITPHNAFNTQEAIAKILTTTQANIESFTAEVRYDGVLV